MPIPTGIKLSSPSPAQWLRLQQERAHMYLDFLSLLRYLGSEPELLSLTYAPEWDCTNTLKDNLAAWWSQCPLKEDLWGNSLRRLEMKAEVQLNSDGQ